MEEVEVLLFETDRGKVPYQSWEAKLSLSNRAFIRARINRLRLGNFGDYKSIQGVKGLFELRIHLGPGYRIYFGRVGKQIVILLCGGDKSTQRKDLQKAKQYWQDYILQRAKEKNE